MTAAVSDRDTPRRNARDLSFPAAAGARVYMGTLVALTPAGFAVPASAVAAQRTLGRAMSQVDNVAGAAGDRQVDAERGCFLLANSAAGDQVVDGDYGQFCYVVDDSTVAKTNGAGVRPVAGVVRGVTEQGVWVEI